MRRRIAHAQIDRTLEWADEPWQPWCQPLYVRSWGLGTRSSRWPPPLAAARVARESSWQLAKTSFSSPMPLRSITVFVVFFPLTESSDTDRQSLLYTVHMACTGVIYHLPLWWSCCRALPSAASHHEFFFSSRNKQEWPPVYDLMMSRGSHGCIL